MSRDLTCNETLAVEDSERNKESIVRRFPASSSAASAPFRPNYTASVPSVKYTIQKPASKSPFLTTSPAPHIPHPPGSSALLSSDDSSHNQLASAIHTQLQNTNGPKLYKPGNSEYTTSAGVSPSQLQMFAGSALLRNAVAAAGYREDRPSSNSGATLNYASQLQANTMHANIYTTISSMRLQQLQPTQPSPDKSLAAGAFAAVQATTTSRTTVDPLKHGLYHPQAMYKNIVPQSAQQATLLPRATLSPHLANRYAVQNGTKRPSSPKLIRPQSAAHHLIPHQSVAAPNRLIPGHSMAHGTYHVQAAPASPIPSQPVPQIITTSSPRPSILRKRGDGSNASSIAKRRLPFMEETSTPSSTTSQTTVQQGSAGTAPPTLNKEAVNGTGGETPRKRLRKQQFEPDATPEQIKMAIDVVQPIAGGSGAWKFAGHTGYITSGGAFEKKRRGRPRANTRPATALPMELHQSVSVFVDIDSPEEKLKPTIISESSSVSRGSTASVPPVHIEVPENEKVEAEESQGTSTLAQQQASSHEGTQRKHVNKRKDRTNVNNPAKVPTNLRVSKSSGEADSDVCSQSSVTVEEQQLETVTGFLASCLRERRKEQQLKQQKQELDPPPSGSKSHSEMVSQPDTTMSSNKASFRRSTMQNCEIRSHLLANHFATVKEFRAKYEQFRKRRLLQHQRVRVDSNVNVKETAEKCVENGENNIASTFNRPGFKPVKPMSASEKSEFISFVENVIRERLKKKRLSRSNVAKRRHVDVECRLPVVSCKRHCLRIAHTSTTSDKMGTISSDNADIMYTEQLLDEMISFITRDESTNSVAECAERTLVRKAAAVVRAPKLECQPKVMGKSQISARSQAHTQGETFTSILKNLKSFTNESRELFDNVFTVGPAYHKRSWWNIVTSKKSSRTRGRKSLSRSLPLPQFPKSDTSYRAEKIWSPEVVGESMTELNPTSLREEVAIRLQHMNRQLIGQLRFEERVLEIFERFYGVYNPYECFKMKLDMERDIDDGDSSDTVYQKKIQRLRFVLSAPPCKLPPDRKPDFGEQCASVISSPDEADMNRLMLGISPFWKGPLLKSNTKCFYLTRTGRRMHDKDEFYLPLEDDYKEFYLEDLEDYRDPAVFRRDYSNMERLWEQLQKLQIKLSESVATEDIPRGDWISRRRLARCKDSDDVICLGSVQTDVLKVLQDFDKPLDDEKVQEFLKMGESAQEILASAFKAIRQTTLLMIQTRNAILELVHSVGQNCDEDEDDEQYESADDEEDFNRQLEQAIQESCQELQSTSKT